MKRLARVMYSLLMKWEAMPDMQRHSLALGAIALIGAAVGATAWLGLRNQAVYMTFDPVLIARDLRYANGESLKSAIVSAKNKTGSLTADEAEALIEMYYSHRLPEDYIGSVLFTARHNPDAVAVAYRAYMQSTLASPLPIPKSLFEYRDLRMRESLGVTDYPESDKTDRAEQPGGP